MAILENGVFPVLILEKQNYDEVVYLELCISYHGYAGPRTLSFDEHTIDMCGKQPVTCDCRTRKGS